MNDIITPPQKPHKSSLRRPSFWRELRRAMPMRFVAPLLAMVILASSAIPALDARITASHYNLDNATSRLVGPASPTLTQKITQDPSTGDYTFNKDLQNPQTQSTTPAKKVGGAQYSVTIKQDPKQGITYYDPASSQSFTIKPNFDVMAPQKVNNHIVLPLSESSDQQVLTFKGNGLKEDLVLPMPEGDNRSFSYTLDLPASLEARIMNTGEVGIYTGSDSALFGNISYGSDKDRALVQKAQAKAKKDKLVFVLPVPIIKQAGGNDVPQETKGSFSLKGNTLTVNATGLKHLAYPVSIDPSTIVTSANDFDTGTNEGNTNIDTSNNQISRTAITGGGITGGNHAVGGGTTALATGRSMSGAVAYNNNLYVIGGCTHFDGTECDTATGSVELASIASDGSITAYNTHSSGDDLPVQWYDFNAVVFNGYIYVAGGLLAGASPGTNSTVYVGKIASNGHISSWTTTSSLSGGNRGLYGLAAAGGYLYAAGGCSTITITAQLPSCSGGVTTVESAAIKEDGTLGGWAASSSLIPSGVLGGANYSGGLKRLVVYNNILYFSSLITGTIVPSIVEYNRINYTNGSLNSWTVVADTANASGFLQDIIVYANSGYLYGISSGYQLDDSGATVIPNATVPAAAGTVICLSGPDLVYKNHTYCAATGSAVTSRETDYASFDSVGGMDGWNTSTALKTGSHLYGGAFTYAGARMFACSVAYDGYIYVAGGENFGNSTATDGVESAQLLAEGGIGSWTNSTTYSTALGSYPINEATCQADNGYLYFASSYWILYAPINAGVVGNFSLATGGFATHRDTYPSSSIYHNSDGNTYLYVFGGINNVASTSIQYGKIEHSVNSFTNGSRTSNVVTLTGLPVGHGLVTGDIINVTAADTSYNTTSAVTITGTPTSTSITFNQTGADDASSGAGTAIHNDVCGWNTGGAGSWDCTSSGVNLKIASATMPACIIGGVTMQVMYGQTTVTSVNGTVTLMGGFAEWPSAPSVVYGVSNCVAQYSIAAGGDISGGGGGSPAMLSPRVFASAAIWNGYIYLVGGYTATNGSAGAFKTPTNTTEYSSGGGSWTSTGQNLPATYYAQSEVAYEGYVYIAGGDRNNGAAPTAVTLVAAVNNGGGGGSGPMGAGTNLPAERSAHASFAYNGYLYVAGGCDITSCATAHMLATVNRASLTGGSIGTWITTDPSLPTGRYGLSMQIYNGTAYVMGGCVAATGSACATYTTDVYKATVSPTDGSLSSWSATTSLPSARAYMGAVAYNDHMYVVGGCTADTLGGICGTAQNDVYRATITSTGALSSWTTDTSFSPNVARWEPATIAYNGYLYIIGGATAGQTTLTDVLYAPINSSTGAIGSWAKDPNNINVNSTIAYAGYALNGYIFVMSASTVQSAPIGNSGALNGPWSTSSNAVANAGFGLYNAGLAYYNGIFYLTGGYSLFFATLKATSIFTTYTVARTAIYSSKFIDTDIDTSPAKIMFNGTNTGDPGMPGSLGLGGVNVIYRSMTSSGSGWGNAAFLNAGPSSLLGTPLTYTAYDSSGVNMGLARGYLVTVVLDDSQTATFPDATGNFATVSDYTLWYHPGSIRRLRGGETFTGSVKQSLDAPPQ